MSCPYCDKELIWHDWFGKRMLTSNQSKLGDIYKCDNEECSVYQEAFYTLESEQHNNLHEGYPC